MASKFLGTGLSLPALRGRQGSRTMYLVLPTNDILNTFFTTDMEPMVDRSQRALDPKHAKDIGQYIAGNRDEYLLGAITYAVDVEAGWDPSDLSDEIGILHIPLKAKMRSIDGQHRRTGIKEAIDVIADLGDDHTALLIYVENDVTKRRQMFSDMNWTPRVVSKAVNVGFDSRDPFARATNRLVEEHPLLKGFTETESSRVAAGSDKLYGLGSVYDALKRLFVGPSGRVKDPSKFEEEELYAVGFEFFDLLFAARPEYKRAQDDPDWLILVRKPYPKAEDKPTKAERERSILFSSTTLRVIAGAVYLATREDENGEAWGITDLSDTLSEIDFSPDAPMWIDSGFVSPEKTTPNARNQEVLAATRALAEELGGE